MAFLFIVKTHHVIRRIINCYKNTLHTKKKMKKMNRNCEYLHNSIKVIVDVIKKKMVEWKRDLWMELLDQWSFKE